MEAYLNKLFESPKATQKPLTIKHRKAFILSIANIVKPTTIDLSFLRREKIVLARVQDTNNVLTQYNRLCHIVKAIELEPSAVSKKTMNRYVALLKRLKPQKIGIENDNRLTDEQKDRYLTLGQIKRFVERDVDNIFKKYDFKDNIITDAEINRLKTVKSRKKLNIYTFAKEYQQLVIAACYIYQPAIRNNYGLMKLTNKKSDALKDKEFNYYFVDKRTKKSYIIMNQYKNEKHLGKGYQIELTNQYLKNLIFSWLKILLSIYPEPKYMFYYSIQADGKIVHSENQTTIGRTIPRIFEKITGKALSINDLRHIHEIDLQKSDKYKEATVAEREKMHKQLLHGHLTGLKYNLLYTEESKK